MVELNFFRGKSLLRQWALIVSVFMFGAANIAATPALAEPDEEDPYPCHTTQQCQLKALGLWGELRPPVLNDSEFYYVHVMGDEYGDHIIQDLEDELDSDNRYNFEDIYEISGLKAQGGGSYCNGVCGQRTCSGMAVSSAKNSRGLFVTLSGAEPKPEYVPNCPLPSVASLRALHAASAYVDVYYEGLPENFYEVYKLNLIKDAYAVLTISQEIGYDPALIESFRRARVLKGFLDNVASLSHDAIVLAGKEASARFNRRTYTAHITGLAPERENGTRTCPNNTIEVKKGAVVNSPQPDRLYCDGEAVFQFKPTQYHELVGFLQPPDFFPGGPYTVQRFSNDSWRRDGSNGFVRRSGHRSDADLLSLAEAIAEEVSLSEAEFTQASRDVYSAGVYGNGTGGFISELDQEADASFTTNPEEFMERLPNLVEQSEQVVGLSPIEDWLRQLNARIGGDQITGVSDRAVQWRDDLVKVLESCPTE